jgi:hypothetical protein
MLQHLPEFVAVAPGRFQLRRVFDREEASLLDVQIHSPSRSERDDYVITFMESKFAKLSFQRAAPLVHPPCLVGLGVAIEVVHAAGGTGDAKRDIAVAEQWNSGRHRIRTRGSIRRLEGPMLNWSEINNLRLDRTKILGLHNPRGKEMVIEQRLDAGETLQTHEFFTKELAVRLSELCMPLVGDLPQSVIERHMASFNGTWLIV